MREPRHGLPPCDHDECPPTKCARDGVLATPTCSAFRPHPDPQEIQDAIALVAYARQHGFPNAEILFWDQDYNEIGHNDLGELIEDAGVDYKLTLGISLGTPVLTARRDWLNDDDDELFTEPYFVPNK